METVTIPRPGHNLVSLVTLLLASCIWWSIISCQSEPSKQPAADPMPETIAGEQMRVKSFYDSMRGISLVEQEPGYSSSESALASLVIDADRIFQEARTIRVKCLAAKIADGQRGHITFRNLACDTAILRESFVIADVGAPGAWSDPHQIQPRDDADDIRSQILRWSSPAAQRVNNSLTFESSRLDIQRYAGSVCNPNFNPDPELNLAGACRHFAGASTYPRFKAPIDKAELYKRKAYEAAEGNNWAAGYIFLRHSQMVMDDARVRAIDDAYSRSTNFQSE